MGVAVGHHLGHLTFRCQWCSHDERCGFPLWSKVVLALVDQGLIFKGHAHRFWKATSGFVENAILLVKCVHQKPIYKLWT